MISMNQYEYVRTAYRVYGKSIRTIERETGHDRKTIRKVLRGEYSGYSQREAPPNRLWGRILRPSTAGSKGGQDCPKKPAPYRSKDLSGVGCLERVTVWPSGLRVQGCGLRAHLRRTSTRTRIETPSLCPLPEGEGGAGRYPEEQGLILYLCRLRASA